MQIIRVKKLYTDEKCFESKQIIVERGKILEITNCEGPYDYENIASGFFDAHINGGKKFYFTSQPSKETLQDIAEASHESGTFYTLPTLITSSTDNIKKGIATVASFIKEFPQSGIVGLHLEGPFLNPLKRGAHLAKYLLYPTDEIINEILTIGKDVIKIWTMAPELFSDSQLKMMVDSGITISAGHSNANYEQAKHGFDNGIQLVTHLYNAMSNFQHRNPGLIGATLARPEVWAPIILDGKHCHYGAAKTAYLAKPERLFLVSDALFLGRNKLRFEWEEFDATLIDGQYKNSDGNLAGSAISLGEAVQNAVNHVGIPIEKAIAMASSRPANAIGIGHQIGSIASGYPAVFTSFTNDLKQFEIVKL